MKRVGHLWEKITSRENIALAVVEESHTKRMARPSHGDPTVSRGEVMRQNLDEWVAKAAAKLATKPFQVDPVHSFWHKEGPKNRYIEMHSLIDAVCIRAMVRVVEPVIYARMTPHSYCPIKGRGPLKLARRMQRALRRHKYDNERWMELHPGQKRKTYCLKTDIRKFFPSIAKDVALKAVGRWIKDRDVMAMLATLLDDRRGIPIGSGYSAMVANSVMLEADWLMASFTGVLNYWRYMDDIVMLFRSKEKARAAHEELRSMLSERGLSDDGKWSIFDTAKRPITLGGFKVRASGVHIGGRISRHILQIFGRGAKSGWDKVPRSQHLALASLYGWIKSTDSFTFKSKWRKFNADRVFSLIGIFTRRPRKREVSRKRGSKVDSAFGCHAYLDAA